jgi:glutamine amidotransferase
MCRLLAIASSEATDFRVHLRDSPRSLSVLSREHPHGWGLAVYLDVTGWRVEKNVLPANEDARFHELAHTHRGETLVAHVRQKTVGRTAMENTHPFERDGWVFAHNGTIHRPDELTKRASKKRLDEVVGETDSERLFAVLLTRLDEVGVKSCCIGAASNEPIREFARELRGIEGIGAFNFVLSNGLVTFAHRFGRTLFLLSRGTHDPVRRVRVAQSGTIVETPWSARRRAAIVASEALTDEPWVEIPDGALLRIDRQTLPTPLWLDGVPAPLARNAG